MNRILSFFLFLTVFSVILYGIHYFVFSNISRHLGLNHKTLNYIKWVFIGSGASIIAGSLLSRLVKIHILKQYSYIWLGAISIVFSLLLVSRILILIFKNTEKEIISVSLIISIIVIIFSLINQSAKPGIKEILIRSNDIGHNFSIVQLSDIHLESSYSKERLKYIVDTTNSLNPDIIVITGDLMDESLPGKNGFTKILSELRSKKGVYCISGNHEYYTGMDYFYEFAKNTGMEIIDNKKINISEYISLTGLSDSVSARSRIYKEGSSPVVENLDKKKFNILIAHRPYGFEYFSALGVDLQLSGHTHAGQIPPMDLIVKIFYKFPYGLYRIGDSHIYTSSGTGIWGPPMRFLNNSEIVHIKIKKKQ
ncbi:MAG: metallophosphoesterase [Acidobacteriota bacterium]